MQIGSMNNPREDICKEIEWIAKNGFDFIDCTLEPTASQYNQINITNTKKLLLKHKLGIVGHIGDWALPKYSDYESLRKASEKEILNAMTALHSLGAKVITIHAPEFHKRNFDKTYQRATALIKTLLRHARKLGVRLVLENTDSCERHILQMLHRLLKDNPTLGLHIDVGHANIGVKQNITPQLLKRYGKRVMRYHLSDNSGRHDEHLALGKGKINWPKIIKDIKRNGYDGTITVETFRSGRQGTINSMKTLRKLWMGSR
ncbi:TPA: sugar phosphate isomerase/epimerase [Candidatus Woesearchaeota archaeon]|nr:sugar phosphate isomerase/epimerase [Candidatus Woesearchaeota archaeon]